MFFSRLQQTLQSSFTDQQRAAPRAKLVAPLCRYTGVTRKVPCRLRADTAKYRLIDQQRAADAAE